MSSEELRWRCLWSRAFPTLSAVLLQSNSEGDHDDRIWEKILAWRDFWNYHCSKSGSLNKPGATNETSLALNGTRWAGSLGYGEITPESVLQVFDLVQKIRRDTIVWNELRITDLGSGRGVVLLVLLTAYQFGQMTGIELNPQLHFEALRNFVSWQQANQQIREVNVDWRLGDFTVDTSWISSSDVVICHATVFEDALVARLTDLCSLCPSGTLFIMVSRPLHHSSIETLLVLHLEMSWGRSTVFIQAKL